MVYQSNKRCNGAIAWQRSRVNARGENFRRRVMKQRQQTPAASLSQHRVCCKLTLGHLTARQLINRSFRNTDLKVLLDAKKQVQKIHGRKTQVVEKKLLRFDRFSLRKRQRLPDQRRHLLEGVRLKSDGLHAVRVHAVKPPSTHQTCPVT